MKKSIIVSFLFITVIIGHTKEKDNKLVDTSQNKKTIASNSKSQSKAKNLTTISKLKIDTLESKYLNKNEAIIPVEPNKNTKIILVKEKNETDYPKYLLPIFTLLLGILINKLLDKYTDRIKIKKAGERWIVELRSTEEPIKAQIESLETFIELLSNQENEHPTLSIFTAINGEVFKSLDKNDLIKYIEQKNEKKWYQLPLYREDILKREEYKKIVEISNKTHGHISILVHQFEMIKEKWDSYLTGTSTHTTAFTKDLQIFNKETTIYSVSLEKEGANMDTDSRFKPLFDLYMAYIYPHRETGKYNPLILETHYFLPIIKFLTPLRLDERTIPLASAATSCLNDIAGIKMEKTYMIENANTLIRRYKEQLEDLNPLINEIEGVK
ncbi:hypothetical protein [Flavobacterium sp.]|jgi:hypothetical protein|uniref:hypothetical protein n=1 Tax=Flavobacterium sp. TaxID=239 RepID=UPI0037C044C9